MHHPDPQITPSTWRPRALPFAILLPNFTLR